MPSPFSIFCGSTFALPGASVFGSVAGRGLRRRPVPGRAARRRAPGPLLGGGGRGVAAARPARRAGGSPRGRPAARRRGCRRERRGRCRRPRRTAPGRRRAARRGGVVCARGSDTREEGGACGEDRDQQRPEVHLVPDARTDAPVRQAGVVAKPRERISARGPHPFGRGRHCGACGSWRARQASGAGRLRKSGHRLQSPSAELVSCLTPGRPIETALAELITNTQSAVDG